MPDGASVQQVAARYSAFLSYSHVDARFARKLQYRLEGYRFPRTVRAARGTLAPRLKPIFRDRDELAAASDLSEAVRAAIAASDRMIVVCSAHSALSPWVRREVALFRTLHGPHTILAALVEGASPEIMNATFGEGLEPLAADFSPGGDGERLALLKLVAALADVGLDELVQRDAQRRVRSVSALAACGVGAAVLMAGLSVEALRARRVAEREQARSAALINTLMTDVRTALKRVGRLDVLDPLSQAVLAYYRDQNLKDAPAAVVEGRAKLLQAIGEDAEKRGKLDEARAAFEEARRGTAALLAKAPDDRDRIFAQSQSEYWVGFVHWRLGDFRIAEAGFRAYADLVSKLVRIAPDNTEYLLEKGYAASNLGTFFVRSTLDLPKAESFFLSALAAFREAAVRRPDDDDLQIQLADAYNWLADTESLQHDYDGSLLDWRRGAALISSVLAHDGRNADAREHAVSGEIGMARTLLARGDANAARFAFEAAREHALALCLLDPDNVGVRLRARLAQLFAAEALLGQASSRSSYLRQIAAEIGDCARDRGALASDEVHVFCMVLRARAEYLAGDSALANQDRQAVEKAKATNPNRLTERFGIDLESELSKFELDKQRE